MLTVPGADGCEQLVDDGGVANVLMHKGTELEPAFAKDGTSPDPERTTNPVFNCILQLIKDATKWTNMVKLCKGVIEETTTGVLRPREMRAKRRFALPRHQRVRLLALAQRRHHACK